MMTIAKTMMMIMMMNFIPENFTVMVRDLLMLMIMMIAVMRNSMVLDFIKNHEKL